MNKLISFALVATLIVAIPLVSQITSSWLPVWLGNHYQFIKIGPGLVISDGALNVQVPQVKRIYGQKLLYESTLTGYRLPVGAKNIVVLSNGLRNFETIDYTIDPAGVLKMLFANSEADIRVDFDSDITVAR